MILSRNEKDRLHCGSFLFLICAAVFVITGPRHDFYYYSEVHKSFTGNPMEQHDLQRIFSQNESKIIRRMKFAFTYLKYETEENDHDEKYIG